MWLITDLVEIWPLGEKGLQKLQCIFFFLHKILGGCKWGILEFRMGSRHWIESIISSSFFLNFFIWTRINWSHSTSQFVNLCDCEYPPSERMEDLCDCEYQRKVMKFVRPWVTTKWKKGVGGGGGDLCDCEYRRKVMNSYN